MCVSCLKHLIFTALEVLKGSGVVEVGEAFETFEAAEACDVFVVYSFVVFLWSCSNCCLVPFVF